MKEMLMKIIDNEIMYSIIVPFVLMFLGWVKNAYDIKVKSKKLSYWMMKYRKYPTFEVIVMRFYKMLAINLIVVKIISIIIRFWNDKLVLHILNGIIYFSIGSLCLIYVWRKKETQIEFIKNGREKKVLLISLCIIYIIPFFYEWYKDYVAYAEGLVGISLIVWMYFVNKYSDLVLIWENSFANIYINGSDKAEYTEVEGMQKQGEWIIVYRWINGYEEEIRIRESDIVRIDYYGEPRVVVINHRIQRENEMSIT